MNLKKDYETLAKKHHLPPYDELDKEFELLYVTTITEIKYPLRFIRRRIADKLIWTCNALQTLLQPNPASLVNLHEATFFTKDDKHKITHLLKELMSAERRSLQQEFNNDETKDAEAIRTLHHAWKTHKNDIHWVTTKICHGWDTLEQKKETNNTYVG